MITLFRIVAIAEACSWAGLLTGMAFKHSGNSELGVQIFGPIHGFLVMAYVLLALLVAERLGWSMRTRILALAAAIPPFATLIVERRLLSGAATTDAAPSNTPA